VVLPPYLTVSDPGQGMLPRVPHNLSENLDAPDIMNDLHILETTSNWQLPNSASSAYSS
jgi:hypothetical protein